MTDVPQTTRMVATPVWHLLRRIILALTAVGLLAGSILFAVSVGAVAVPRGTVWGVLANHLIPNVVRAT